MPIKDKLVDFKNKKINTIYQEFVVVVDDTPLNKIYHSITDAFADNKQYIGVNDFKVYGRLTHITSSNKHCEEIKNDVESCAN